MAVQTGKRYLCTSCGAQVVITRAGTEDVQCCGQVMELFKPGATSGKSDAAENQLELGKRYKCEECNAEAMVTKAGKGPLYCHGEMKKQEPRKLASAD